MTKEEERKRFDLAEVSGREKASRALRHSMIFKDEYYKIIPTDHSCRWDFEIRDKLTNKLIGIAEAKDRYMRSDDDKIVNKEGAQLEKKKYDVLKEQVRDGILVLYICTYTDNRYLIWNINTAPITENKKNCNRTTAVLTDKIPKECVYFRPENTIAKGDL